MQNCRTGRTCQTSLTFTHFALLFLFLLPGSRLLAQSSWTPSEPRTRIDYPLGLVYYEDWNEGYYTGVTRVESLDSYLNRLTRRSLTQSYQEAAKQQQLSEELTFDQEGLIPEITLPKIPLFGESKIDIAGQDRITFGGSQTSITGLPQLTQNQSWLPELKMEQALKINLNGTIGDKTRVFLDHDSEREEAQNKIKLTYTGSEDEIVQSIEAGDAALSIPGTGYTGDLPSHKGLFGVAAKGKLGGIDLYGVAAREQSESQSQTFQLKNQSHVDTIFDTDFLRFTFYAIDTPIGQYLQTPRGTLSNLRVYIDDGNQYNNTGAQRGRATIYPFSPGDSARYSGDVFDGYFDLKMPNTDYVFTSSSGVIQFVLPIGSNYTIGLAYNEGTDAVGGYNWWNQETGESLLVLKLIKPQRPDSTSLTWTNELKNVYRLSSRDIKLDTVKLIRWLPSENPTEVDENGIKFTQLIGLDPDGDNIINYPQVDRANGFLMPNKLYPFIADSLTVPDSIYRLSNPSSWPNRKYRFVVTYSTAKESYNLNQIDIMENSEKVYVNNAPWTSGTDYTIDYKSGELSFKRALPADADIRVTFEYTPLFSVSQKSIMGARAEWKFSDQGKFGSSVFYRTEGTPDDRPSLGSEPFRRMVGESDFNYDLASAFVTSLLDKVPLVRVDAPTAFHVGAEGAVSLPDPNTQGAAYLDDFEGTTVSRDVTTSLRLWQFASVPVTKTDSEFARQPIRWLNPTRIAKDSIFTGLGDEGRETVEFLRMCFFPDNLSSWAGLMNCPSRLGMNLTDLENLEAVFRTRHRSGRVHITVATSIDEDAPRRDKGGKIVGLNGREDTEDKNQSGVLETALGEDVGIDSVPGNDAAYPGVTGDDGNDDFNVTTNPTGTEGNGQLDGEDLMGSGWTRANDYLEFSFRLDDTTVVKSLNQDWKSLRIPLNDSTRYTKSGSPRLDDIRVVRVWFDSFPQADTIDFYTLQFVGSKWRNPSIDTLPGSGPADPNENVKVALISKKTDPNYNPPFEPKKDALGNTELEAALSLSYDQVKPQHRAIVRKVALDHDDYRDYGMLRVYVHDDQSDPTFFLQVGADSANYYEFRQQISTATPVTGRPNWYELQIRLDTLPTLKARFGTRPDTVTRLDVYSLVGNPSLSDVRYMGLGVENATNARLTGAIWVDDIRLTAPSKTMGFGFNTSMSLRLSDLASVGLSYRYDDPNFRRFSEGREVKTGGYGNGVGLTVDAALDRLTPASWGMSLPFNYSVNSASVIPKYSSNYPDLRLRTDSSRAKENGANRNESYSISVRKNPSKSRLLNYTLEALGYSYRHSSGLARSLLDSSRAAADNHSATYSISPDLGFHLGETEINYFPQSIHVTGGLANNRSPVWHRNTDTTAWTAIRNDSTLNASYDFGVEYSPISDVSFDYSTSADLDRTDTGHVAGIKLGQESNRDNSFTISYDMDLNALFGEKAGIGDWLSPKFDYDGSYSEERPRLAGHYGDNRNVNNEGNIDFTTDFDLPEALAALSKLRDTRRDTKAQAGSLQWLMLQLEKSSDVLSSVDFSYSYTVNSSYPNILHRPSVLYQLGFTDSYQDTLNPVINETRERTNELNLSTGLRIKDLDTRWRFDRSWNRDVAGSSPSGGYDLTWPDVGVSLARVERIAPKLLTTSSLSSNYQRRVSFAGTFDFPTDTFQLINRRITTSDNLSPLLSWQATWKNKFSTTLAANYSNSTSLTYLEAQRASSNRSLSENLAFNLGYSFSAPQGLKIPGLKRFKFTSDLSVSWGLTYGNTLSSTTGIDGSSNVTDNSRDIGTTISLSYRFSHSIESGLNGGYTAHNNIQRGINTGKTDLSFWVLFKF
jgi:hypothetical protein